MNKVTVTFVSLRLHHQMTNAQGAIHVIEADTRLASGVFGAYLSYSEVQQCPQRVHDWGRWKDDYEGDRLCACSQEGSCVQYQKGLAIA